MAGIHSTGFLVVCFMDALMTDNKDELCLVNDLLRDAANRAISYLSNLGTRPVFPVPAVLGRLTELGSTLSDDPTDPEKVLALLDEIGSPATVASVGGRYFGFVVGGTLPVALAANWLAAAWDQNAMSSVSSPVAAKVEEVVIPWLLELLHLPGDCAGAFVTGAMMPPVSYLPQGDCREPWKYTPEASRRARGIEIWAALRFLGRSGVADLIERTCSHATRFAIGLRQAGYSILNEVVLNQVLVSFGSDDKTKKVLKAVQDDGTCWCSTASWHGQTAMRISVSSWATTENDVDRSLSAILRVAAEC